MLTESRRHRDPWLVECQIALDGSRPERAIELVQENGAFSMRHWLLCWPMV